MRILLRIFLSGVIVFILAEMACRILMPSYVKIIDNKTQKRIWLYDVIESSKNGKKFKPNLDLTIYNAWISHKPAITLRTNSLGLRGSEIDPQNFDQEFRILILGDSITWAGYLSEQETYVFQLQNLLNKEISRNIRTINAGIGDVGIIEETKLLKAYFDKIKPKVVILSLYLNDSRPPFGFESEKSLSWARLFLENSRFIGFLYGNMHIQLYLMRNNLLGEKFRDRWFYLSRSPKWRFDRKYFQEMVKEADLDWGAAWKEDSWAIIEENIHELKSLSIERGFDLILVCLPVSFQVYSEFLDDYPQEKLMDIARNKKILYLDILPILRKNKDVELFYDHCHLNAQGQRIVAEELARYIIANNLIP